MKRNPDTSKLAEANFTKEQKETHYGKIIEALKVLQLANAHEIAKFLKMEHVQINRRLHEMRDANDPKIYRTEIRHTTTPGNFGYCYALSGVELPQSIYDGIMTSGMKTEKALKGDSVSDYSRKLTGSATVVQLTMLYNRIFSLESRGKFGR